MQFFVWLSVEIEPAAGDVVLLQDAVSGATASEALMRGASRRRMVGPSVD
jgi:hypothetical protein